MIFELFYTDLKQFYWWIAILNFDLRSDPLPPAILNWLKIEIFPELLISSLKEAQGLLGFSTMIIHCLTKKARSNLKPLQK